MGVLPGVLPCRITYLIPDGTLRPIGFPDSHPISHYKYMFRRIDPSFVGYMSSLRTFVRSARSGHSLALRTWHRILLVACVLSAIGLTLALVELLRAAVHASADSSSCYEDRLASARMTARLTVYSEEVDTPSIHSTFVVVIPRDWPRARALLSNPSTAGYRSAMRCLFNPPGGEVNRSWEDRLTTPEVKVDNSNITVTDDVDTFINNPGSATGPWRTALRPNGWTLGIVAPVALRRAMWSEVSVVVGSAWRYWVNILPAEATVDSLVWKNIAGVDNRWLFELQPDWQASMVGALSIYPGSTWSTCVAQLSYTIVLIWALFVVRRAGAENRWLAEYPLRAAKHNRAAYLRASTRRATRLVTVQLAVVIAIAIDAATYDSWMHGPILGFQPSLDGWGSVYWLVDMLFWGAAISTIAWACRLRAYKLLVVVTMGCIIGSFGPLVGDNHQAAFGTAYLVMLIIGMAVLNVFRLVRHPFDKGKYRTPMWVWLGGIAFATASLALFINRHAHRIPLWGWLEENIRPFESISENLVWYPWAFGGLLTDLMGLVIIVTVIAQLHARTAIDGPRLPGRDLALVVWVFAAATTNWQDYVGGVWLPITVVLAGSIFWMALTLSRRWAPLNRPVLRAAQEQLPGGGLKGYKWLIEEARKSYRSSKDVRADARSGTQAVEPAASEDAYHVQLAFALGPYSDPWRTARFAMMVTGVIGIVPGAWFMWMEFSNSYWTYAGGQEFGGVRIPTVLLGEVLFWLVPGLLLGLLWRHLPGRAGAIKVLPIAASYVFSALGHLLISRVVGQDPVIWTVQRSLLLWGVLSITAITIDFKTLRLLEYESTGMRYDLATLYGISGWPARLSGLVPQIAAIALLIYVVVQPDSGLVQSDPLQLFKRG
ncbi:DUF6185 family protein [Microbispora bryophytorum]|uniref:DUF6185 family protein n=1 Tax=Microbispora bryophytorum TaxID=1460882 RepID=UPI0033C17CC7